MRRPLLRTSDPGELPVELLAARKARGGHRVSVCLPARDEADTVGAIVETIVRELQAQVGLVDEVLVVDDHSADGTAEVAAAAGARVVAVDDVLPELGPGSGKGEALWKSVAAAEGDLIVWCDADVTDFRTRFVTGLLGPLLLHSDVDFVKGYYDRPVEPGAEAAGGGRVTELVARPVIALLHPHLSGIVQPLGGEYAGRRSLLERLPFVQGYGVDLGLLLDVARLEGTGAIAQVDLGTRRHRNRSLEELGPQALEVLLTALSRARSDAPTSATLVRPDLDDLAVELAERPPLADVPAYRRRSA